MKNKIVLSLILYLLFVPLAQAQSLVWEKTDSLSGLIRYWEAYISETSNLDLVLGVHEFGNSGIIYMDKNGNNLWTSILTPRPAPWGWLHETHIRGLKETTDNQLMVVGSFEPEPSDDNGRFYYRKLKKSDGSLIREPWFNKDSIFETNFYTFIYASLYEPETNTFMQSAMSRQKDSTSGDAQITKLDSNGQEIWHGAIYSKTLQTWTSKIIPARKGGYFIFGGYQTDPYNALGVVLISYMDSTGHERWRKFFQKLGVTYGAWDAVEDSDSGVIMAAWHYKGERENNYPVMFKVNNKGDSLWMKEIGIPQGKKWGLFTNIMRDKRGGYILAGQTGDYSNSSTNTNFWIMKLDSNYQKEWDYQFGIAKGEHMLHDLIQTSDRNYVVTGELNNHIYLAKIQPPNSGVEELENEGVRVYPNPASTNLDLKFSSVIGNIPTGILITNVLGQNLELKSVEQTGGISYDISPLSSGIYFVSWKENGVNKSKKFVVSRR